MPYVSRAQQRWAHTATGTRALGGAAKVHEWDEASKGMKLPARAAHRLAGVKKRLHRRFGVPRK